MFKMDTFIQGFIMAFREGLEAFLIAVILLKFLDKTQNGYLKKNLWYGVGAGIGASFAFGLLLKVVADSFYAMGVTAKLWESAASLIAVGLIITFIIWMINHGSEIKAHIEGEAALNLSPRGIFFLSAFMVIREGAEIVLFQFAGAYTNISVIAGLLLSIILTVAIYYSLVKVKLQTIFNITLAYLVLQAGFLLGYSLHEGFSAAKDLSLIAAESPLFIKAFDLSGTVFYHKEGLLGLPLYVAIGWYSKPEWIQFVAQYLLTFSLFIYWYRTRLKTGKPVTA
jgi:high-affinity iron transporter